MSAATVTWSGPEGAPSSPSSTGPWTGPPASRNWLAGSTTAARVVRYDRRGYGRATPHAGPFTIAAHVDDLLHLLDERPAVLVGHSLGGDIVLAAAARRPDLALGVSAFEPPMPWTDWWPRDSASAEAVAAAADSAERDDAHRRTVHAPADRRRAVGGAAGADAGGPPPGGDRVGRRTAVISASVRGEPSADPLPGDRRRE